MRVLRWLGIVVAVVVVLPWLLYVVLANGLITSRAISKLLYAPDSTKVTYGSGWTLWPGVVHATGLRIVVQDHNIESVIDIGHVDATIRLRDLTSRVLHATKVRGTGVVFRFRNRVDPESAHLPSVAALPPIPGMADPPLYEAWAPPPPLADKDYYLWSVHLEDVDVQVAELWVQQFRYLGSARAVGAFRLVPARRLWVGPASLELGRGKVIIGPDEALAGFSGRIDCVVHPFDVRVPTGLEATQYISARVQLGGDVLSANAVNLFLPSRKPAHIEERGGRLDMDGTFELGEFQSPSVLSLSGDDLEVTKDALAVRLEGPFRLGLTKETGEGAGRLVLDTTSVFVRAPDLRISGRVKLDVNRDPREREAEAPRYHGGLRVNGLDVKGGANPRDAWSVDAPSVSVEASLDVKDDRVAGPVTAIAKQVRVKAGHGVTKGDLSTRLRLLTSDFGVPSATIDGSAELTNASFVTKERWMNDWWAHVEVKRASIHGPEMDGRFVVRVLDGLPALMVLESEKEIPKWLAGALPRNPLSATLDVSRHCGVTDVQVPHANGDVLEARGRIQPASGDTQGAVLVRVRRASILSAGMTVSPGHSDWLLFAGDDWFDARTAELSVHAQAACASRSVGTIPDTRVR